MHRIVFLERASVDAAFRRPSFPHEWAEYPETKPDQVLERLAGATIVIANKVALGREILAALPTLKLIAVAATGVNLIDLDACRALGISVSNVRDYATHTVPEHALLLMLALRRNLFAYRGDVFEGAWGRSRNFCLLTHPIVDLFGSVLGVIGYGTLGRATAQVGCALGMSVLVSEHKGEKSIRDGRTLFERVIEESDIISLHAPLTEATRHMIGPGELSRMKRDAILVNTARGGLVDEAAVKDALLTSRIGGAGFDVLEREPPRDGSPLLEIADRPNVIITPHVAWASKAAMQALADQVAGNMEAFVRGEPRNRVV